MKTIDIDRELLDLMASEEMLAFFDFVFRPEGASAPGETIEGLCKISRPRERSSKATYLSVLLLVDAPDEASHRAAEAHLSAIDWTAASALPGIDCFLTIPSRGATGGMLIKEVDAYLDGTRGADAAYVRAVLQPAIARAARVVPGELTVWEESEPVAQPASAPQGGESLLDRARRLVGLGR